MRADAWFVTVVPPVAIAALLIAGAGRSPWTATRIAALILTIAATGLLTIARINLGNSFSISPEARALVTRGIYSRIRHPVYVFSALVLCGLAIYFQLPALLLLMIPLIAMQVVRARREEQVLESKFGDEYRAYRRKTWF